MKIGIVLGSKELFGDGKGLAVKNEIAREINFYSTRAATAAVCII